MDPATTRWCSRPRRYLTVMNVMWGVGCLPFLVMGIAAVVATIWAKLPADEIAHPLRD